MVYYVWLQIIFQNCAAAHDTEPCVTPVTVSPVTTVSPVKSKQDSCCLHTLVWETDLIVAVGTGHRSEGTSTLRETVMAYCRVFNSIDKLTLK